ncbi:Polycomb eed-B-like protein [Cladobotryum mycophilum]|uniref:Polycomb eed-B-like protein n=1 Tax=Cladobotryum mycophilum TaxID=491253 RepID=A0ABR0T2E7_9HYPO
MATTDESAFELPKLRVSFGFENDTRFLDNDNVAEFFDVKFCPYQPLDCDAVFAAVSKKHIVLCRLSQNTGDSNPCEVINIVRDDDVEAASCCCTWTKDPDTGDPYLCIGGVDAKVKIYDVVKGQLIECFVGHGGDVNDLATSPVNPSIIASASDDTSVRIWSIDKVHKKQPCLCVLAGEGHSWNLLSLAFHDTGRYLLSAGHDQIINMWTIPDLPTEHITTPLQVHYPHFSTSAVHSGIVDCVAFYGDLILSRACHDNVIVLWRIEGFSSDGPPPSQTSAPTPQNVLPTNYEDPGRLTRSAFVPVISPQCPVQYTRLLEFHTPNCGPQFFMRFKLHHVPNQNPVLAFCNAAGNIFFWDFKRLTTYHDFIMALSDPHRDKSKPLQLPSWQKPVIPRHRTDGTSKTRHNGSDKEHIAQSLQVSHSDNFEFSPETLEAWAARYSMEDTHEPLRAHKSESSSANFVGRQAAWSPGGEWCVVVGSSNTTLVLQRWNKKGATVQQNPVN